MNKKEEDNLRGIVLKQNWFESEKGWEYKPDGYSLHQTVKDYENFVKQYWLDMPNSIPTVYSRPIGRPYLVRVNEEIYQLIQKSEHGIRRWEE